MRRDDLVAAVRTIARGIAESYGVDVFDVQFRRESIGWVLRIVLDRRAEDGALSGPQQDTVTLDDCQRVSHDLSAVLDVELAYDHPYTLEVSSPGLDRPLRHLEDCRRFTGRRAVLVTTQAVGGQHHLTGRIEGVEAGQIVFGSDRQTHRIPWDMISRARLDVEF